MCARVPAASGAALRTAADYELLSATKRNVRIVNTRLLAPTHAIARPAVRHLCKFGCLSNRPGDYLTDKSTVPIGRTDVRSADAQMFVRCTL